MSSCDIGKNPTQAVKQHFLVQLQWMVWEFFNPFKHCTLVHPCILQTKVLTASWKCGKCLCSTPTILLTFENQHWRQLCSICTHCHSKSGPSCVLCGSMDGECLYISHLQSLFGVRGEEERDLIHIDNDFFTICLTYCFPYLLHEIGCIWCCLCRRAQRFICIHLVSQSLCLQPPMHNQWLCTIQCGTKNSTQIRCLSWHNLHCHYHSLLMKLKHIPKKMIIHQHQ